MTNERKPIAVPSTLIPPLSLASEVGPSEGAVMMLGGGRGAWRDAYLDESLDDVESGVDVAVLIGVTPVTVPRTPEKDLCLS